jgi:hypothetical protein
MKKKNETDLAAHKRTDRARRPAHQRGLRGKPARVWLFCTRDTDLFQNYVAVCLLFLSLSN